MKTFLPLMTPLEVKEAAERDAPVLLPIGTIEVNGHHLPLGYDYLVAEELANRVAAKVSGISLPPIAYGISGPLDSFAGTIPVTPDVLRDQVHGILSALVGHGFTTIVVLNNHIPNQYPVEQAIRAVRRETGVLVPTIVPSQIANDLTTDMFEGRSEELGHGGEPGTSMMLALYPDAVRRDLAEATALNHYRGFQARSPLEVAFKESRVSLFLDIADVAPSGGWGDVSNATAERGEEVLSRMVDFVADFIEAFSSGSDESGGR
jgi:creatinine amidohydrolase